MMIDILEPILKSKNPKALIDELNQRWQKEQERRHALWKDIDENIKAEFIDGEAPQDNVGTMEASPNKPEDPLALP